MNQIRLKNKRKTEDNLEIDIGSCIKIENSNEIFQIIGINNKKTICWIREWPLNYHHNKTFALSINKVKLATNCPNIRDKV
tara:strand:- start:13309 stop:13551 length:243 start_codon:yes stop_codon:yes gene_type:complete